MNAGRSVPWVLVCGAVTGCAGVNDMSSATPTSVTDPAHTGINSGAPLGEGGGNELIRSYRRHAQHAARSRTSPAMKLITVPVLRVPVPRLSARLFRRHAGCASSRVADGRVRPSSASVVPRVSARSLLACMSLASSHA